ncbi:hypothetical protein NE848_08195 [Gramella jeungdoensis]|uniref:Uncharacterized protein n=1 Tax=Gramella jeungdoensis TaxID=708091 RepID=A0ABT0Z0Y1_9FLAO|nr:hypothetical protein [Gramella jeungdoensis]MCM8569356.1 hypothetical protein [Gramella jeungdoensis]
MENLKNLGWLLLLFFCLTSCEKESIVQDPGPEAKFEEGVSLFKSKADFEAYLKTLPKSEKAVTNNKAALSSDDLVLASTLEEFNAVCSETISEDFSAMAPNLFMSVISAPLSSSSDNFLFSTATTEGFAVTSESEKLVLLNFGIFESQIYTESSADAMWLNFDSEINALGLKLFHLESGDYVIIELYKDSKMIDKLRVFSNPFQSKFIGINSTQNFDSVKIYSERFVAWLGLDEVTFGACSADADGDGCLDEDDPFVNSNMEDIITIGGCSTGIENQLTPECGVYMSDLIGLVMEEAKNHGDFVSSVTKLTRSWVDEGLINETEKADIIKCAALFNG